MKSMSESLYELAARIEKLEDSAAAVPEWALGIAGALSVLLGVVLLVFGVTLLTLAWQVRHETTTRDLPAPAQRRRTRQH